MKDITVAAHDAEGSASVASTLILRVAEARVEDVGHAIVRLAPTDLSRLGAHPGDILKITGSAVAVGRAELSDDGHEGMIQIDGTCRSNSGAGLQEHVAVATVERQEAVAVRFSPLWVGAPPAIIAPDRMLEDLMGVPVVAGCAVRVPTFAKAVNFQVVRTIPSGAVVIGKRTDIRVVEGDQTAARAPAVSYEDIGGLEREVARVREIVETAAQAFPRLRAARNSCAQGRLAIRASGDRQNPACPRRCRRKPRALYPPERPRDHAEVLRRERGETSRSF